MFDVIKASYVVQRYPNPLLVRGSAGVQYMDVRASYRTLLAYVQFFVTMRGTLERVRLIFRDEDGQETILIVK